jgi:hypothetical protein
MNINFLISYLRYLNTNPDSIQNPSVMRNIFGDDINSRRYEIISKYLHRIFGFDGFQQLDVAGKQQAVKSTGVIWVPDSYNYIQSLKGQFQDNFFQVGATIIFKNNNRRLLIANQNYRIYTIINNSWVDLHPNLFYQSLYICNILYKLIEIGTGKTSYVIFIDTNYSEGNIDIQAFVNERIIYGLNQLQIMLGTHGINQLGMSFTFMNNAEDDIEVLPAYIDTVMQFLSVNPYINCVKMIDMGNDFFNYFSKNQNF